MRRRLRRSLAFVVMLSVAVPAAACLWDYDTLQMERERFPGALELIVGKFLRHTDEFYEWRVKDRRAEIAAHDSGEKTLTGEQLARAYDDLAAALDKLKRHDEAIATIREKAERLPKVGEYETHANLGTFLVHSGRLGEGVAELRKAIEINPDAHFGREIYQVLIVEYVMEKQKGDRLSLPLDSEIRDTRSGPFVPWLLARQGQGDAGRPAIDAEIRRATQGVLGMMRFGDYQSPVLLEVLGDLLLAGEGGHGREGQAQRLAARAYLRAGEFANNEDAKQAYRYMALAAIDMQYPDRDGGEHDAADGSEDGSGLSMRYVEDQLRREVKEADEWFATTIAHDEKLWVEKSPDPDRRFWEKYGGQEIRVGRDRLPPARFASAGLPWPLRAALGGAALFTVATIAAALYWRRRRPTGYENDFPRGS